MRKLTFAAATALVLVASAPAFAEGGWSSSQMSSRNGDRGGSQNGGGSNLGSPWGMLDDLARRLGFHADRAPRKFESSSQRDRDPFNSPTPGRGMTGGDAGY